MLTNSPRSTSQLFTGSITTIYQRLHEFSGPTGGQNVNKVSPAIHLRFDIAASSAFSDEQRTRLLALSDQRISNDGLVIIKSQRYRSQEKNRRDALDRLAQLLQEGLHEEKPRKKTRPSRKSKQKIVDDKTRRGRLKEMRSKRFEQ